MMCSLINLHTYNIDTISRPTPNLYQLSLCNKDVNNSKTLRNYEQNEEEKVIAM